MSAYYPRGFLLCRDNDSPSKLARLESSWARAEIDDFTLHYDPAVEENARRSDEARLILLGRALDPFSGEVDSSTVCHRLHAALERSWQAFFDALDDITGRFALFAARRGTLRVVQDATGVQGVVYDPLERRVASHPTLLAECFGYEESELFAYYMDPVNRRGRVCYLPGVATPFAGVSRLTPNTYLDLDNACVTRFFPREPNEKNEPERVVPDVAEILQGTVELLARTTRISMSLTAGIDSRLSLAAARPVASRLTYYTYVLRDSEKAASDAAVASELCARLGLTHTTYRPDPGLDTPELREFLARARRSHGGLRAEELLRLAFDLLDKWPSGYVHLKSNLGEIARAFYRRTAAWQRVSGLNAESLATLYAVLVPTDAVVASFQDFIERTGFSQRALHDYDWSDIFYWEHRAGTWHTLQVADFDAVHDTFLIYNNRRLLSLLLSAPLETRMTRRPFRQLIRQMWPAALQQPINPRSSPSPSFRGKILSRFSEYQRRLGRLWG